MESTNVLARADAIDLIASIEWVRWFGRSFGLVLQLDIGTTFNTTGSVTEPETVARFFILSRENKAI